MLFYNGNKNVEKKALHCIFRGCRSHFFRIHFFSIFLDKTVKVRYNKS